MLQEIVLSFQAPRLYTPVDHLLKIAIDTLPLLIVSVEDCMPSTHPRAKNLRNNLSERNIFYCGVLSLIDAGA